MRKFWQRLLASLRLSDTAICEESRGRDLHNDYHDYPDSTTPEPWHGYTHTCARCGKAFTI